MDDVLMLSCPANAPSLFGMSRGVETPKTTSPNDQLTVRECLAYVLRSGALAGGFETRMGVTERTVEELLNRWPEGSLR